MVEPVDTSTLPLIVFVVGVALTLAEAFIPGAHFIVLGVALLVAGLLGIAIGGPLAAPLGLAITTLLIGAVSLYLYRELGVYKGGGVARTSDSDSLKGETGKVTERVTEDSGEVKLQSGGFNPYYRARTMEGTIEEGKEVIVLDPGGGNVVTVAPMNEDQDEIDRELARERRKRERERERAPDAETEER